MSNQTCQFHNCTRIANYRKLKVANAHLKDTPYEFCGYHRPINSINKKFSYRSIFDKINIELKYYNHQNEHIIHEYHDHIHNLLENHRFKFPIKITLFTENLVHDVDYMSVDIGTNISHIPNYENYFDKSIVSKKDIYNTILKFQNYYNKKKIEMLYIYKNKDYDIFDIVKEFRNHYEDNKVNDIIKNFKNHHNDKNVEFENIFNLLIDFRSYYKNQKVNIRKLIENYKKYYYKKKIRNVHN